MAAKKQYADAEYYERKLDKVMAKLEAEEYSFNWDRWSCYVEFRYKGQHTPPPRCVCSTLAGAWGRRMKEAMLK